ncbi:hypothetical protein [Lysobacter sp. CA196]|uniref:hypothetical protein n=1 Tax=Lysobacter sp. CA196 TaxID=3455606 RepID=UPI003F8D7A72
MIAILSVVDVLASSVLAWVCGAFLLGGRGNSAGSVGFNTGLLLLAVGVVALAFLPVADTGAAMAWGLVAKIGGAWVAAGLYEQRFGWAAQARAALATMGRSVIRRRVQWRRLRARWMHIRTGGL